MSIKKVSKIEKTFLTITLLVLSLFTALSSAYIIFVEPNKVSIPHDVFEILGVLPTFILLLISSCKGIVGKVMPIQTRRLQYYIYASILISSYSAAFDLDVLYLSLTEPYSEWYYNLPKSFLFMAFFVVLLYFLKTKRGKHLVLLTGLFCVVCETVYYFQFNFTGSSFQYYYDDVARLITVIFWCATIIFFPACLPPKRKATIYKIPVDHN